MIEFELQIQKAMGGFIHVWHAFLHDCITFQRPKTRENMLRFACVDGTNYGISLDVLFQSFAFYKHLQIPNRFYDLFLHDVLNVICTSQTVPQSRDTLLSV